MSRQTKSVSLGSSLRGTAQFLSDRTGQTETVLCALIVRMVVVCLSFQSIAQIKPEIIALVTIGIFGFKDWIAPADSPKVKTSRQHQADPVMVLDRL